MYIYKNVEMNERAYHIYIFFLLVLLKWSEYKKICILCSQFPLFYFITRSPFNSDFLIFNDIIRLKWQLWGGLPPNPSTACVRCWCSEQTPETSAMCMCPYTTLNKFRSSSYHLITCYRNLFVHLIFQRWRDSRRKKNKESVLRSACSWRPNSNLLLGETRTLVTMGNQSICELMHRMNMYKALSLSISPPGGLTQPWFCTGSPRFTCVALLSLRQLAK